MRGVVSGGMVTALDQLKLHDVFDLVVGTSAGALAGAYFLARQPAIGTSIYYEDLVGAEWLDYRRALRRRPVVSLDYLIDQVMRTTKPLDTSAVLASPAPLYAVAARVPDFKPVTLGPFRSEADLLSALRASARIPLMAGRAVQLDDGLYFDGSMAQSIPASAALALGATHVLALLTRPAGALRGAPSRLQRTLLVPLLNRISPGVGSAFVHRASAYKDEIELLQAMVDEDRALVVQIDSTAATVGQLEQDPVKLKAAAEAGVAAVYRELTGKAVSFSGGLTPVPES